MAKEDNEWPFFTNVENMMRQHGENTSGAIKFIEITQRKRENKCDVSLKKNASSGKNLPRLLILSDACISSLHHSSNVVSLNSWLKLCPPILDVYPKC